MNMSVFNIALGVILMTSQCQVVQSSCPGSWTPFKTEKCFKVFDQQTLVADQAVDFCKLQNTEATLLSIKSAEEQAFLTKLIFDDSNVVDHVWIAAKRDMTGVFQWGNDNSAIVYKSWDAMYPSTNLNRGCAQMTSLLGKQLVSTQAVGDGLWHDVSCLAKKTVVCQMIPGDLSSQIALIMAELLEIKNNPVPIGFVYVQLPEQEPPKLIWPSLEWTEVTDKYAGLFFRAEGLTSEAFGTPQKDNSPRLTKVSYVSAATTDVNFYDVTVPVELGVESDILKCGLHANLWAQIEGHKFLVEYTDPAKPEVRPVNTAVKIWIRIVPPALS